MSEAFWKSCCAGQLVCKWRSAVPHIVEVIICGLIPVWIDPFDSGTEVGFYGVVGRSIGDVDAIVDPIYESATIR
jgi:hypothetical protein